MEQADVATSVDVGISDEDLFNSTLETQEPEATPQPEAPQEQPDSQPRDANGRFAAKDAQPEQPEAVEQQQHVDHRIPLAEHLSVRDERNTLRQERDNLKQQFEDMQRQFAQMQAQRQQPQTPAEQPDEPDPLLDPRGYREHMQRQMQQELAAQRREMSMQMAARFYKDEWPDAYKAAVQAVQSGDDALRARMHTSADPGETVIEWYRQQRTIKEVGHDPNAWLEKKLEERLNDPAFLAKAIERARGAAAPMNGNGKTAAPNVQLPPSLSRATGGANHAPAVTDADMSDEALFRNALRS